MVATQIMQAMGPREDSMKPLPSLPSPTLTNPDMVLPDEPIIFPSLPSPPRNVWRERPPSPSYLRDKAASHERSGSGGSIAMAAKKEKRGLMSRKMMLLRSRTASSGMQNTSQPQGYPHVFSTERSSQDYGSAYGSSPTLLDVANPALEQAEYRRASASGSSTLSEDMRSLPQFLAKYETGNASGTDDEFDSSPAPQKYGYAVTIEGGLDEKRRQQEEDEHTSAILSQRAEQILANAKKRLNLMEGNLRGARDLVTPLTAANLKRATSVGSSYISPANHGSKGRYAHDGYYYDGQKQQPYRALHTQASSPTMGRDYHQGHWRGFSETELPERPYTALERAERTESPIMANGRIPAKANDPAWTNALRGSRSYDSLGANAMRRPNSRDPLYAKASPDPNLEPLVEDESQYYTAGPRSTSSASGSQDGLGIRSPSRTEDLHEKMSSLKGRISSLKERAKEDSLRRQSMQNLREPSPLNNATVNAPEFFYTSSPSYGSPVLDTKAGVGWSPQNDSPDRPQAVQRLWEPSGMVTGSRNAFAEQAERQRQQGAESEGSSHRMPQKYEKVRVVEIGRSQRQRGEHKRTPSGTAIIQSSKQRYSHHQYYHARDSSLDEQPQPVAANEIGVAYDGSPPNRGYEDDYSDAGASEYQDAETEQAPPVVAHEDRADAFDYENFFLHSAMGSYSNKGRRNSASSGESVSSVETAKGPTTREVDEEDDMTEVEYDDEIDFEPSTPETPEKLKEIERNLHKRTFSDESVSTLATFATATEGRDSPEPPSNRSSVADWPIRSSGSDSRPGTAISRPSTAIPIKRPILGSDSSSERADSGVGLEHRPHSSGSTSKRPFPGPLTPRSTLSGSAATTRSTLSPPMSPRTMIMQDPATVVVNALLEPNGRQLGLKDKAMLFGVVESLRKVCSRLQESDDAAYESRMLRNRLESVKKVLDGGEARPGTS